MANTIIEYLKEFGQNLITKEPLNEVDGLVLCQLAYLKFDGLVPGVTESKKAVSMQEIYQHADFENLFGDTRYEKENRALFHGIMESRRFQNLRLNFYINIIEKEWETQFSAITYLLEDGTAYVAYRGTDENIIGWKEDFNMAFLNPVPGQAYSVKYLNMVTEKLNHRLKIGGHSKGGNLAVYAAMNSSEQIQERIINVYSMDGPGFRPEVLAESRYQEIKEKVVKILPQSSLVGMLFEKDIQYKTVASKSFGLAQHNPYTWIVENDDFRIVSDIYESRKFMDDTLNEWILSLNEEQLTTFVDSLYQVISASEADNMIEFSADLKKSMNGMVSAIKNLDEETSSMLRAIIKSLFDLLKLRVKEELKLQNIIKNKMDNGNTQKF